MSDSDKADALALGESDDNDANHFLNEASDAGRSSSRSSCEADEALPAEEEEVDLSLQQEQEQEQEREQQELQHQPLHQQQRHQASLPPSSSSSSSSPPPSSSSSNNNKMHPSSLGSSSISKKRSVGNDGASNNSTNNNNNNNNNNNSNTGKLKSLTHQGLTINTILARRLKLDGTNSDSSASVKSVATSVRSDQNEPFNSTAKSERVRVVIRVRPIATSVSKSDRPISNSIKVDSSNIISIRTRDKKGWLQFKFDAACSESSTQKVGWLCIFGFLLFYDNARCSGHNGMH